MMMMLEKDCGECCSLENVRVCWAQRRYADPCPGARYAQPLELADGPVAATPFVPELAETLTFLGIDSESAPLEWGTPCEARASGCQQRRPATMSGQHTRQEQPAANIHAWRPSAHLSSNPLQTQSDGGKVRLQRHHSIARHVQALRHCSMLLPGQ